MFPRRAFRTIREDRLEKTAAAKRSIASGQSYRLANISERLTVRDIQATPACNQEFSTRRCFLVKNRRPNSLVSNHFRGPQPGRPRSNDNSRGFVQRLRSNIRMMGSSARRRIASGSKISGDRFASASRSFSKVFFFMNRQSAQAHLSVGSGNESLARESPFFKRWSIPDSVTMMNASASESRQ